MEQFKLRINDYIQTLQLHSERSAASEKIYILCGMNFDANPGHWVLNQAKLGAICNKMT